MSKKMRDSNIELLRILAVMGVVLLHFNGIYGNAFEYAAANSVTDYMLRYLEGLAAPAVNLFLLISGYYMCDSYRRDIVKPLCLITQVMVLGEVFYLLTVLVNGISIFSVRTAMYALVPCNYYVVIYIALYFISPYINLALMRLGNRQWKQLICILLCLFSVFPIVIDVLQEVLGREFQGLNPIGLQGDQAGYTIVQFCLMYVVGAYLKKMEVQWSKIRALAVLAVCSILLLGWCKILPLNAWAYCNPIVILEAVAIFLLFQQIHIRSKWINRASKAVFTCFLSHGFFVRLLPVEAMVEQNKFILLLLLAATLVGVYLMCWGVYGIYYGFEKYVVKNIWKIFDKVVLDVEPIDEGETCK